MPVKYSEETTLNRYSFSKEEFVDALIQYLNANGFPEATMPDFSTSGELPEDRVRFIGRDGTNYFLNRDFSSNIDEFALKIWDNSV